MKRQPTKARRVGRYFYSHGFLRAYQHNHLLGLPNADASTQIGSTASDDTAEFHARNCALLTQLAGEPVREFWGGYYTGLELEVA